MIEALQTFIYYAILAIALAIPFLLYLKKLKIREERAREAAEKGKMYSSGPTAQHPHIDNVYCIGCSICTHVCPEGDVLARLGGTPAIVNGPTRICPAPCP